MMSSWNLTEYKQTIVSGTSANEHAMNHSKTFKDRGYAIICQTLKIVAASYIIFMLQNVSILATKKDFLLSFLKTSRQFEQDKANVEKWRMHLSVYDSLYIHTLFFILSVQVINENALRWPGFPSMS
jgi:hypothetical protein